MSKKLPEYIQRPNSDFMAPIAILCSPSSALSEGEEGSATRQSCKPGGAGRLGRVKGIGGCSSVIDRVYSVSSDVLPQQGESEHERREKGLVRERKVTR